MIFKQTDLFFQLLISVVPIPLSDHYRLFTTVMALK